jgi:hypothetical protein
MSFFMEKNFTSHKGHFPNFSAQEPKKIKTPENKEKCLFYNSLIYLLPIQNYMKPSNFQKFCQNHWTLMYTLENHRNLEFRKTSLFGSLCQFRRMLGSTEVKISSGIPYRRNSVDILVIIALQGLQDET